MSVGQSVGIPMALLVLGLHGRPAAPCADVAAVAGMTAQARHDGVPARVFFPILARTLARMPARQGLRRLAGEVWADPMTPYLDPRALMQGYLEECRRTKGGP